MLGSQLQAVYQVLHKRRRECGELRARLAHHPLGERRPSGYGRRAASSLIARFHNAAVFKSCREPHQVSASGVGHFHARRGRIQKAHVAWIAEVVEGAFRVHAVLQLSLMIVVAAVIERGGQVLVCRRKPRGRHPLKWEFPGGKVEAGEHPGAALKRELREELGIDAEIGVELARHVARYGDGPPIDLRFYSVTQYGGEIQNLDFAEIAWSAPARLLEYDFLEGDIAFVKELVSSTKPAHSS